MLLITYEIGTTIIPVLQIGKLRPRHIKKLYESPRARKWQSWNVKCGGPGPGILALGHHAAVFPLAAGGTQGSFQEGEDIYMEP